MAASPTPRPSWVSCAPATGSANGPDHPRSLGRVPRAPAARVITEDLPVEAVDFLTALRVERGRSANTLRGYRTDLRAYIDWLDERGLTLADVTEEVLVI